MIIQTDQLEVPSATEHEKRLLSCLFLDSLNEGFRGCLRKSVALGVTEDTFFKPLHKQVWRSMSAMKDQPIPLDELAILDWCKANKEPDIPEYKELNEILNSCVTTTWFEHWLEVCMDTESKRQFRTLGMEVAQMASEGASASDMGLAMEKKPKSVLGASANAIKADLASEATSNLIALNNSTNDFIGIATGISAWDYLLGGIRPGTLNIIAARPSRGKTTIALQVALNVATINKRIRFWSLEMSPLQLLNKLALNLSGVMYQRAKDGLLSNQELRNYENAANAISNMPIDISKDSNVTVAHIAGQLHRDLALNSEDSKPELVIVDYLQLITPADRRVPREQQIAQMTRDLKMITRDTGVPIILLAQLSRECEKDKREPRMSDLREGGSSEQDADTITFLHHDEALGEFGLRLLVAKNREDKTGKVEVTFNRPLSRIYTTKTA